MTVAELIEELKNCSPSADISIINFNNNCMDIKHVENKHYIVNLYVAKTTQTVLNKGF